MEVNQIMTRNVLSCRTWDSLGDAAQKMLDADCGCIPVVSDDGSHCVVGIVTDRDICMATLARDKAPSEIIVGDVMSKPVHQVPSTATLAEAEAVMRKAQIRRVPIVDRDQKMVGILALADLAREAERLRASEHPAITEDEIGDTLSAISSSSTPTEVAVQL